jgi:hypothetical protein
MENTLKEMFGSKIVNFVVDEVTNDLDEYVNLYRFQERNCAGCMLEKSDCPFAYDTTGNWSKAVKGELFDCPVRRNGTLRMHGESFEKIDISDRSKPVYPVIKKEAGDE